MDLHSVRLAHCRGTEAGRWGGGGEGAEGVLGGGAGDGGDTSLFISVMAGFCKKEKENSENFIFQGLGFRFI